LGHVAGDIEVKVALIVAQFLRSIGIKYVFAISGGSSLHLIHGIADTEGIDYVCNQHEQACGFSADAYSRIAGIGCAMATSGPGFTNLLTPIAASYADSIPVFYVVGNTATGRLETYGTRQVGFQYTPTVEIARPITKYAVTITDPKKVKAELEMAYTIAMEGRRGPVLIDLPDDVQRADV
jgi:acetolactate synthase I/II/III large subunit